MAQTEATDSKFNNPFGESDTLGKFIASGEIVFLGRREADDGVIEYLCESATTSYVNPNTGNLLTRRHGTYQRVMKDLPLRESGARLVLKVFKYRDTEEEKSRGGGGKVIVTEQFPGLTFRHGRMTAGLYREAVIVYTGGLSATASEAIMAGFKCPLSDSTILRAFHREDVPIDRAGIKVLMIDDVLESTRWDGSKVYITGIHDAMTCELLEYVKSRDSGVVSEAIAQYPDVTHVSMDMADCYVKAANLASEKLKREVIVVTDKFHLAKSERKAGIRDFYSLKDRILEEAREALCGQGASAEALGLTVPMCHDRAEPTERKGEAVKEVQDLFREDPSLTDTKVAELTGLSRATVALYKRMELPEGNIRHNYIDFWTHLDTISECIRKGKWIDEMLAALKKGGMNCSESAFRNFMKKAFPKYTRAVAKEVASGRRDLSGLMVDKRFLLVLQILNSKKIKYFLSSRKYGIKRKEDGKEKYLCKKTGRCRTRKKYIFEDGEERKMFQLACSVSPTLDMIRRLNLELSDIMARKSSKTLDEWSNEVRESGLEHLVSFLATMEKYKAGIQVGIDTGITNSPCEGVNCLFKCVKRVMFGKGRMDLMMKKVILLQRMTSPYRKKEPPHQRTMKGKEGHSSGQDPPQE